MTKIFFCLQKKLYKTFGEKFIQIYNILSFFYDCFDILKILQKISKSVFFVNIYFELFIWVWVLLKNWIVIFMMIKI